MFKIKSYLYPQPNYLIPWTAIAREQKQFIKIAFAVHLSAVISAERYRSDSGALKSAVLHQKPYILVQFLIISFAYAKLIRLKSPPSMAELDSEDKYQQSAAQRCLKNNLSEVFPLTVGSGKTMTFENRPMIKVRPCTFFHQDRTTALLRRGEKKLTAGVSLIR